MLDVLTEEQKREKERAKELEKAADPVEKEKLELKFDVERTKVKQKMKNLVKRHAEELAKLQASPSPHASTTGAKDTKQNPPQAVRM